MAIRYALLILLAFASLAKSQPNAAKLKKELAEMQGIWRLIGFELDGKEAYLQDAKQTRLVIKGDKLYFGGEELARLTLDPTATPRCIDLAFVKSKRVHEGIYQLEKNRLKICAGVMADGVKDRPLKFGHKDIDKYRTMLLVRDKPGTEMEGVPGFVGVQLRLDAKTKEVQVVDTLKDSPAQKAGLKKNDVILKVGADAVEDLEQTINLVRQMRPGSITDFRVRRSGKEQDVKVKVGVGPFRYLD